MCLNLSYLHKKKNGEYNAFVAKEDILVYKCLDCEDGRYCTPFQYMPIEFKKGVYSYSELCMKDSIVNVFVSIGIHSYTSKKAAISVSKTFHSQNGTSMHYAVIPKGSIFYIGLDNDIISNNLIVHKTKKTFDKHYSNVIGVNTYVDKYITKK